MSIETLSAVAAPPSARSDLNSAPRFVRLRDAPRYLGMDKNRFNRDVRLACRRSPSAPKELPSIARSPYPLTREEQGLLFRELPDHVARMALFKVNTGLREQEVCGLKWEYEVKVPELDTSVFVIPGERIKNGEERLVVLNRVAKSVVESLRGLHPVSLFVRNLGKDAAARPLAKIYNTAWKAARERAADAWEKEHKEPAPAGFRKIRVHDLKHYPERRTMPSCWCSGAGFMGFA
jgi:integrase